MKICQINVGNVKKKFLLSYVVDMEEIQYWLPIYAQMKLIRKVNKQMKTEDFLLGGHDGGLCGKDLKRYFYI